MTTAHERTKAVIETRKFLQMLASADEVTISGLVQSVAVCLLRHYPLNPRFPSPDGGFSKSMTGRGTSSEWMTAISVAA
ncbi:BPSL0761 family protein [Burkholderia sp. SCN-KJ]|uniref:BPSL0761 family protein n=1 Tax=Burkholderia sp. SCN-KJ TaxID=2969248 RepID=UPI0027E26610|nr:BPSL0761 family protein [Burkholderia sp. SCN-KJ]